MEFSVNTTALSGLAQMMDRRWQDYETGRGYLKSNAHFSIAGAGVLNLIFGHHQQIVDRIDAFLTTAAEGFAGPCSTAVTQADAVYRRSDRSAAARLDAALPNTGSEPHPDPGNRRPSVPDAVGSSPAPAAAGQGLADPSLGPAVFADPLCPSARYAPLPDHYADHPYRFTFFDIFSPASWAREIIWQATGLAARWGLLDRPYDVLTEAVEPLCGDWAGYLRCADVYDNIAAAIDDAAVCVTHGAGALGRIWTGNAGEACAARMRAFARQSVDAVPPLRLTAQLYRQVAESVYQDAEAVAALLTIVLDLGVEARLGTENPLIELTTETADIIKLATRIREIAQLVSKAKEAANAAMDTAASLLTDLGVVGDWQPVPVLTAQAPTLPLAGRRPT